MQKPKKVRGDLTKIKRPEQYVKEFLNVKQYCYNI